LFLKELYLEGLYLKELYLKGQKPTIGVRNPLNFSKESNYGL
jgi:hypothetical protein